MVRKERDNNAVGKLNIGKPRKPTGRFSLAPFPIVFSFEWLLNEKRTKNTPKNPSASEANRIVLMGMIMTPALVEPPWVPPQVGLISEACQSCGVQDGVLSALYWT